jgi:hypothetical protein
VVEIREADPAIDKIHHDRMRDLFITKAYQPDTTILLGPNVVLDFSELGARDPTIEVTPDNVPIGLSGALPGLAPRQMMSRFVLTEWCSFATFLRRHRLAKPLKRLGKNRHGVERRHRPATFRTP